LTASTVDGWFGSPPTTGAAPEPRRLVEDFMMNTRLLLAAMALVATAGVAQAATPDAAQPRATNATRASTVKHAPKHHAARAVTPRQAHALRRTAGNSEHQRVVLARQAQQVGWIDNELQQGRLNAAQAAALHSWVARLADRQTALTRRGHETVDEALAISHEQDLLDWAIRSGHPEFEPRRLLAAVS
jgi:hypothetical protein